MAELAERQEITIRGHDGTIVFTADSADGRLVIRQIPERRKSKNICSITLADPNELRAFFKGIAQDCCFARARGRGHRQCASRRCREPAHDRAAPNWPASKGRRS
jgi:hypothetical protein